MVPVVCIPLKNIFKAINHIYMILILIAMTFYGDKTVSIIIQEHTWTWMHVKYEFHI